MTAPAMVMEAIDALCLRFELGDYNPTPIVDLGVLVADADGKVDAKEKEALGEVFQALLGARLAPDVVAILIDASLEVGRQAGRDARARLIAEILMDCDCVEQGLIVALHVALASEGLSAEERALIGQIAAACDLQAGRLDRLIADVRGAAGG